MRKPPNVPQHWRRRPRGIAALFVATVVTALLLGGTEAVATPPGAAGLIVLTDSAVNGEHLVVMANDGSSETDLDPEFEGLDRNPAWSPDGAQIAMYRGPTFGQGQIWVVDADGTDWTQITHEPVNADFPTWSPDGLSLMFQSGVADVPTLVSIGLDGSERTELVRGSRPNWSPTGDLVVFERYTRSNSSDIFVMNPDGTGVTNLTRTKRLDEWNATFSPDGRALVFQRSHGDHDLWMMKPDGSGQTLLTRDGANEYFDGYPSYSPDGTKLLSVRGEWVYAMNADGTQPKKLRSAPLASYRTGWQPLPCTQTGTEDADTLQGTPEADVICGLGGDDTIDGLAGDDTLIGGSGDDQLTGSTGADALVGLEGADELVGRDGADRLNGGQGADVLRGRMGLDYLYGWDYNGTDRLIGGAESDRCPFGVGDTVRC